MVLSMNLIMVKQLHHAKRDITDGRKPGAAPYLLIETAIAHGANIAWRSEIPYPPVGWR